MSKEKLSLAEILYKNRTFVLAMLGVPVIGMIIAFIIILYKAPDNMLLALAVIFFLCVQYVLMMFFWMKKVETLVNKEKIPDSGIEERPAVVYHMTTSSDIILAPEEERVLPLGDE